MNGGYPAIGSEEKIKGKVKNYSKFRKSSYLFQALKAQPVIFSGASQKQIICFVRLIFRIPP
jgi:hypothetical protein